MLVQLLIGPNAGTIVDLPVHAAEAELQFGTARKVEVNVHTQNTTTVRAPEARSSGRSTSVSKRVHKTPQN